ncbi:MAG: glycosyltransferase family 39 protein [Anaerolineales bacterium]
MKRPASALLILAALLVAALLRLASLGHASLWLDELYNLTVLPGATLARLGMPVDQHPPLYYLLLHAWLAVGQGELWMRLPSALAGVLAVALLGLAGALLGGRPVGLLAAALLAVSPLAVWYSREARMYGPAGLAWAASLAGAIAILRFGRWRDLLLFTLGTLAGLLLTYSTFGLWLLQAAAAIFLWPRLRPPVRARWLLAQALVALGFAAWWPAFARQLQNPLIFHWSLPSGPLGQDLNVSLTLSQLVQIGAGAALLALVAAVAASRLLAARPVLAGRLRGLARPAAWLVILALAIGLVLGAVPLGLSVRRQLLVFWPVVVLLAAYALARLRRRVLTAGLLALGLALSAAIVLGPPYEDWRGVTAFVAQHAQQGDRVLLDASWAAQAFDYYYHGSAPYAGVNPSDLASTPRLAPGQQAWLVLVNTAQADPDGLVAAWVEGQAQRVSMVAFGRIVISEYLAP